jgi:hypothetical protein
MTGRFLRQAHRWVSMAFTIAVVINFFAWRQGTPPAAWVTALALIPLGLLLISGLCLFVQPYLRRSHASPQASQG